MSEIISTIPEETQSDFLSTRNEDIFSRESFAAESEDAENAANPENVENVAESLENVVQNPENVEDIMENPENIEDAENEFEETLEEEKPKISEQTFSVLIPEGFSFVASTMGFFSNGEFCASGPTEEMAKPWSEFMTRAEDKAAYGQAMAEVYKHGWGIQEFSSNERGEKSIIIYHFESRTAVTCIKKISEAAAENFDGDEQVWDADMRSQQTKNEISFEGEAAEQYRQIVLETGISLEGVALESVSENISENVQQIEVQKVEILKAEGQKIEDLPRAVAHESPSAAIHEFHSAAVHESPSAAIHEFHSAAVHESPSAAELTPKNTAASKSERIIIFKSAQSGTLSSSDDLNASQSGQTRQGSVKSAAANAA